MFDTYISKAKEIWENLPVWAKWGLPVLIVGVAVWFFFFRGKNKFGLR